MACKIVMWLKGAAAGEHVYFVFFSNKTVALCVLQGLSNYCIATLTMARTDFETFLTLITGCYFANLNRTIRRTSPGSWVLYDSPLGDETRGDPRLMMDIGKGNLYSS